ncbi:erythromycin esterase family protein [Streptomyces sp. NPDC000594]|uniref:erythromycin esterase family protein n=1 Tax=Streptomyces sp. NPDC000594 TaxID=3154261 RepID=UPI0033197382
MPPYTSAASVAALASAAAIASVRETGIHFSPDGADGAEAAGATGATGSADASGPAGLGQAVDRLLTGLGRPPLLLGLGEPTHGVEDFPELRNGMLNHLVRHHGFRSVALESDTLAAAVVDDYITTGAGDLDEVMATGFSHGWGGSPANRELVVQLRDHNAGRPPPAWVRFHGIDAPTEITGAPGPGSSLAAAHAYLAAQLPPGRVPHDPSDLDRLLGEESAWADPAAMRDPSRSIGATPEARALRVVADDLLALHESEAPALRRATSDLAFERAYAQARTARGLLRYHAAMASPSADRVSVLLGLRDVMMAENLLAVAAAEARRGPCLVFAHNAHLQRHRSRWGAAEPALGWWSAGALISASAIGDRYVFVAGDFAEGPEPGISADGPGTPPDAPTAAPALRDVLARATPERAFYPAPALTPALANLPGLCAHPDPARPGYSPFDPAGVPETDALLFLNLTGSSD